MIHEPESLDPPSLHDMRSPRAETGPGTFVSGLGILIGELASRVRRLEPPLASSPARTRSGRGSGRALWCL